ncbi:snRNA-activating protein complex subunit 2 isoform X2 [Leuresthes tenuis]|uniref:snRNA-activating protein complex subunit 2 isoform X2 n=1 Tax=Leuresthes tenuis TaxID=355514 RepID=UPI003B50F83F
MKPPPRTRSKPDRGACSEAAPLRKVAWKWGRVEQRKLLNGLKTLSRTAGHQADVDCTLLRKRVPTRSISEICAVVDSLKNKVISCANFKLQMRMMEEKKARKPIDEWTHMASTLTGTVEEMLIVASTEPCTLRNCDPPQVHRPPTDNNPVGRTVPLRPMPHLPIQGEVPGAVCPLLLLETPARSKGPARSFPAPSQVAREPNCKICPPLQQPFATAGPSPLTTAQTTTPFYQQDALPQTVSVNTPPSSPATSLTSAPSAVTTSCSAISSCSSNHPTLPLSTPTTRFGRTSKYATKDSPRTFGVKCVVDFERIYSFLSVIQKPDEDCYLTPMESAIVLDLLMSLPEELPLLDCNYLHNHLIQVYQCVSAPADSRMARETLAELREGLSAQTDAHREAADSGRKSLKLHKAESQSSARHSSSSQSGDVLEFCPPLNPFMVPLKLLMRR